MSLSCTHSGTYSTVIKLFVAWHSLFQIRDQRFRLSSPANEITVILALDLNSNIPLTLRGSIPLFLRGFGVLADFQRFQLGSYHMKLRCSSTEQRIKVSFFLRFFDQELEWLF